MVGESVLVAFLGPVLPLSISLQQEDSLLALESNPSPPRSGDLAKRKQVQKEVDAYIAGIKNHNLTRKRLDHLDGKQHRRNLKNLDLALLSAFSVRIHTADFVGIRLEQAHGTKQPY